VRLTEENLKSEQPVVRKSNIILFLLLVAAIVAVAFTVYLKSQGIDFRNVNLKELVNKGVSSPTDEAYAEKVLFEADYDSKDRPAFCVYKDMLVKCGSENLTGINKKGEEVFSKSVSMNKPLLRTNGQDLLAANLEGNDIIVLNGEDIKWSQKINGSIINAEISESGHVVVVHEARGHRNIVKVFDPRGIEMFDRLIEKNYVLAAKISPSAEQFVINSIDASGINLNPSLEFFDMMGNPFAARLPEPGAVFPSVWYLDNDSLVAASHSLLVYYDKDREEKWRKEFDELYSIKTCLGKYIAAAVRLKDSKSGLGDNLTEIGIYNTKGQKMAACNIEGKVESLQTYSDIIAANTVREVYFLNTRGNVVRKYTSKQDIKEVYFFNKLEAAIVTKSSVTAIKIS